MTMKLFNTSSVQDIANAIRARNGLSRTYKIAEMASAISSIATDGTATADKIFSGYTAYGLNGQKMVGTASDSGGTAIVITDEPDEHGGTIRYINGVSLDGDTVSAGTMFSGVTAHNSLGSSIVGTYVPPTIGAGYGRGQNRRTTIFPLYGADAMSTFLVVAGTQLESVNIVPSESPQVITPPSDTLVYGIVTSNTSSTGGKYTKSFTFPTSYHEWYRLKGEVYRHGSDSPYVIDFTFPMPYYYNNGAWYTYDGEQVDSSSEVARAAQTNPEGNFRIEIILTLSSLTLDIGGNYNITVYPTGLYEPSNYDGYNHIDVEPISSTYVGSGIPSMSSSNLAFATGTGVFTAPSGYYSTNATYTLTPKTSTNIAFNSGTGVFTVSSGYYSSNPTLTLSTRAGTTITPISTGSQIAVSKGYFATGSVYVGAIPNTYVQPTGTLNITSNGTFDVKNYASASVSIAGGEYYELYRSLANHSVITNNITSVSEYLGALSNILERQFEGQRFSGEFVFSNAKTIQQYGFGNAYTNGFTPFNKNADFVFPICSIISNGAFAFYKAPFTITLSSTSAITIGSSAFLSASITSISVPYCSDIQQYAFASCSSLAGIVASRASKVGQYAFYQCFNLSVANVSGAAVIGSYAFYQCSALTEIQLPVCTSIYMSAFQSCISLQTIYAPNCEYISDYAFGSCSTLASISFSQCINIGQYAFNGCSALSYASLPKLSNLSNGGLTNCRALSSIDLPACSAIHTYAFQSCINMSVVILRNVETFGNYAFRSCYNLLSLYLLGSTMATYATGMFSSTPISNYTTSTGGVYGSIYVPASLYNTYITNTSWKTYSARFVSLTDAQIALL